MEEVIEFNEVLNNSKEPKIVVIDGDFILYSATHPFKVVKEDSTVEYVPKTEQEVFRTANEIVKDILSKLKLRSYIGLLGNGLNYRYEIYPDYKANRKNKPKPEHFKELKAHLVAKWGFNLVDHCEVDDAVISYTYHHRNTIIVSPDKDLWMTPGNHYNPNKREYVSTTMTSAHEYFWKSMVIGDNADNIKGIPGKGVVFTNRMWDKYTMKLGYTGPAAILELYVDNYGEEEGVIEFNKNYRCLKISNKYFIDYDIKNYEGEFIKYNDYSKHITGDNEESLI